MDRDELLIRYAGYLATCNRHDWDALAPFLAETIVVNGRLRSRTEYADDLRALTAVFPDYRWQLQRAVVEGDWLAVHLDDTGTRMAGFLGAPGDGSAVETAEFAMYHFANSGLITRVEVTADNSRPTR
ncbi:MAG: ester cyclase [Lapillicoccus sp.]